jgi:hypothetical protein
MLFKYFFIIFLILSSVFIYGCINPKCVPQFIEEKTYHPINQSCPQRNCFKEVINTLKYTKNFSAQINQTINS